MQNLFNKIFGTHSEREIKKINPIVNNILSLENRYKEFSDSDLKNETIKFKERLKNGETLDNILPEAFAVCREASDRVLEMRHYPVQIIGGIMLHNGNIAEMKTGEGKTLVATLPIYLNALSGKGVHVITVNDYLAKRDSVWMGKLYSFLGLSVGLIVHEKTAEERKHAYKCDVTYGTNNEFGFDYLRDNMVAELAQTVQRPYNFAIIDEVDSILIDESRTPLIVSGAGEDEGEKYLATDKFVKRLSGKTILEAMDTDSRIEKAISQMTRQEIIEEFNEYDFVFEERKRAIYLTEKGVDKAEKIFRIDNLMDQENMELYHLINQSLKANYVFKRNIDYVVKGNEIVIVDEKTGRLMDGRRYSEGLHQAIEAKEGVRIQNETITYASITFQNLFRKYPKLAGMTGTAMTEKEEFLTIYGLDVIEIPTNKPLIRTDKEDKVYVTNNAKTKAILEKIKNCEKTGQPILVGTTSVEKSEKLSQLLSKENINHVVLNAKLHEREAHIIAQAGRLGAVTIATNMAGRGTDIILGGNPEYLALQEMKQEGFTDEMLSDAISHAETENDEILKARKVFKEKESRIKTELEEEVIKVKEVGGLYVLGTERHESRRVDNQLRGRSGRQGDAGVSEFVISLEDDLMRLFGSDRMLTMIQALNIPEDIPVDAKILSNAIEGAQKRIESKHFEIRKTVLEYDDVFALQREVIYKQRHDLLEKGNTEELILKFAEEYIKNGLCNVFANRERIFYEDQESILSAFAACSGLLNIPHYSSDEAERMSVGEYVEPIYSDFVKKYEFIKESTRDISMFRDFEKNLILYYLDNEWRDQIQSLEYLKNGIGLRAIGGGNPLQEYKVESFRMFEDMMFCVKENIILKILTISNGYREAKREAIV